MITLKLAFRLAFGPTRPQVVRNCTSFVCLVVVGLTLSALFGTFAALGKESAQYDRRLLRIAPDSEVEGTSRVEVRYDTFEGRQLPVVWLYVPPGVDMRPPGVSERPDGAGWSVSPALLANTGGGLSAKRFPLASRIAREGLVRPDEFLAYRWVDEHRQLTDSSQPLLGFGAGDGNSEVLVPVGNSQDAEVAPMLLGASAFVGLPLLLLIVASSSVAAPSREVRLQLMAALGLNRVQRLKLLSAEAVLLTVPPVGTSIACWALLVPGLDHVPLVNRRVAPGALKLTVASMVAVLLVVTVAVLLSLWTREVRRVAKAPKAAAAPETPSRLALLPALLGVAALAASSLLSGRSAATTALLGAVLLAAGMSGAVPVIAGWYCGRLLRRQETLSPVRLLALRSLMYEPTKGTRALHGLATLLVVVPVTAVWISDARQLDEAHPQSAGVAMIRVSGATSNLDYNRIHEQLPDAQVVPLTVSHEANATIVRLHTTCDQLRVVLACDRSSAKLPWGAGTEQNRHSAVPLVGHNSELEDPTVLVLARTDDAGAFESRVRNVMLNAGPALSLADSQDFQQRESALVAWVLAGLNLALALLLMAILALVSGEAAAQGTKGKTIRALGASARTIMGINLARFQVAYASTVAVGLSGGLYASARWHHLDPGGGYPTAVVAWVLAGVLGTGAVVSLVLGLAPEREHELGDP